MARLKNLSQCLIAWCLLALTSQALAQELRDPAQLSELDIATIRQDVDDARMRLGIQGLGIALYTPEGAFVEGFGVTDIETQEKVSTDTVFYIASSTKSMLALALASLHERGEIDLDQPVDEFAPTAPFPRKLNANRITLRHLLAMSSGIKNPGVVHRLAYSGQHTPDLLWRLIAKTEKNRARRIQFGRFRYTNWNYNLLGVLYEGQMGIRWQDLLESEIFRPLGMTKSTAYMSRAEAEGWSIARPHSSLYPDGARRTYLEKVDATMQSAGGVIMSANDALKWLEVFVENGVLEGRQVIPAGAVQATRKRLTSVNTEFQGYTREHYGLGWYIGPYRQTGQELIHHFGGFSGARSHISYMPKAKVGVAVFINDSHAGGRLADYVANYLYDSVLETGDASERFRSNIEESEAWIKDIRARVSELRKELAARPSKLSQSLASYAGVYAHDQFGTVEVDLDADRLRLTYGKLSSIAQAGKGEEEVRVELLPLEGETVRFQVDRRGAVRHLVLWGQRFDKER